MKYSIVLSKGFRIRIDMSMFAKDINMFLLVSESVRKRLTDEQISCFKEVIILDFSDESLEQVTRALIAKYNISADDLSICTNDEYALLPAARLREALGLKGAKASEITPFLNKMEMKEKMRQANVNIPKHLSFNAKRYLQDGQAYIDEIIQLLGTTHIFAKPVDSVGSQGVAEITSAAGLVQWCELHRNDHNYELDEFITGEFFHIDSVVLDGKIIDVQVSKYAYPNADFFQGRPFGSYVVTDDVSVSAELKAFNEDVLRALSPVPDGCTHMEAFKKANGEIVFLEIAARPGGASIPDMYEKYMGFHYEEIHYRCQMKLAIPQMKPLEDRNLFVGWLWYPRIAGDVTSIFSRLPIRSICNIEHFAKPGQKISAAETLIDRVASVFLENSDAQQLKEDFELAKMLKPVTIWPEVAGNNAPTPEAKQDFRPVV